MENYKTSVYEARFDILVHGFMIFYVQFLQFCIHNFARSWAEVYDIVWSEYLILVLLETKIICPHIEVARFSELKFSISS